MELQNPQRRMPPKRDHERINKRRAGPEKTDAMANLPPGQPPGKDQPGLRTPSSGKTIYHRPLNRTRTAELSQASFAYLFSEMVTYAQRRVTGIQDLEKRCVPFYPVPCPLPSPSVRPPRRRPG